VNDWKRLRELAEAATPGPWMVEGRDVFEPIQVYAHSRDVCAFDTYDHRPDERGPDAEYVAAANPQTVVALLDEVERLRALTVNPGPTLHGSTITEIANQRDAALAECEQMRPVYEAALALRVVTRRAEQALTPADCNRQIVDNANAFRVLFDAVDATKAGAK
jgi:hypothetical protein